MIFFLIVIVVVIAVFILPAHKKTVAEHTLHIKMNLFYTHLKESTLDNVYICEIEMLRILRWAHKYTDKEAWAAHKMRQAFLKRLQELTK